MSEDRDAEVDAAIGSMAEFDRQDAAVHAAVDEQSLPPLSARREADILAKVRAHSGAAAPRPARGRRASVVAGAVLAAAAAVLLLWRARAERPTPPVGPLEVQLGGTSRVLGVSDAQPRRYGPGDDFVLRLVPHGWAADRVPARLTAYSPDGERRPLPWTPAIAFDGAIEFRGDISAVLSAGGWALRAEVGHFEACERPTRASPDACTVAEAKVELVPD